MARLASHIQISAYLARLERHGIHAHIVRKGDRQSGSISVKLAFMDGRASYTVRAFGADGRLGWLDLVAEGPEAEADAAIGRATRRDPDLWVVEVEDPRGRAMLDVLDEMEG